MQTREGKPRAAGEGSAGGVAAGLACRLGTAKGFGGLGGCNPRGRGGRDASRIDKGLLLAAASMELLPARRAAHPPTALSLPPALTCRCPFRLAGTLKSPFRTCKRSKAGVTPRGLGLGATHRPSLPRSPPGSSLGAHARHEHQQFNTGHLECVPEANSWRGGRASSAKMQGLPPAAWILASRDPFSPQGLRKAH